MSLLLSLLFGFYVRAETACTVQVEVRDVIGPATVDLIKRVEGFAEKNGCRSILLEINTPGGSLENTREIVQLILNSTRPYLCVVAPSGGHAGSAGAIILQACHVNGALRGTNLGAATPVSMGQDLPQDIRQKILNDTRSWLEGLTKLRGRSEKFGQDIVLEAKAVTAEEALKLKAIDFVGDTSQAFVNFANKRKVKMAENKEAEISTGPLKNFPLDARYKVVSTLTDPEFAYTLMLGSLALLYFEATHPGAVVPGVAGAVGLVISMVALNKLNVEWGGVLLILLGIGMMIAEIYLPTFGMVGVGGLISMILGSLFLFDPVKTGGYRLPLTLIVPVVVIFAIIFLIVTVLVYRIKNVRKKGGYDELLGEITRVVSVDESSPHRGWIELKGESWKFEASQPVRINDSVRVNGFKGLVLKVSREN